LPVFSSQTFRSWFAHHPVPAGERPVVALFVDTFTNYFSPDAGKAAVRVLEDAGYRVELTKDGVCCGLTWISTGQLDTARAKLQHVADALIPLAEMDVPVVALEPSCAGVLRSEITELIDPSQGRRVARNTSTLAEFLARTPGWTAPDLSGEQVVVQPHCHHHAVMGWDADARLLREAGANFTQVAGCCGLAGNFGVEKGHYDVSIAVGEHNLFPAVRGAGDAATVLADGFSCRTQLDDVLGRPSEHHAEMLARKLPPT
jgi:Fe-S oxidoreductase